MPQVSLIADVGESFGPYVMGADDKLLDLVSDANVACGFHAGDPRVMERTVAACRDRSVSIGAHPGFADLMGFGRRTMHLSASEIRTDVLYQLGALSAFTRATGTTLSHVTVHGRLDNMAVVDPVYANAIVEAVVGFDPTLIVAVQDGELEKAALAAGLPVAYTFMADRAYESDGQAVNRDKPGAVLHDTAAIAERTIRAVSEGVVRSVAGHDIEMPCDAVLIHGDTPEAVANAVELRRLLERAGVLIAALPTVVGARRRAG